MMKSLSYDVELDMTDVVWRLFLLCAITCVIFVSSDVAFATAAAATTDDVVGNTLCRLVASLTGNIAKGIATIAIFAVGVGLFLGKLNWGIAAATAVGVGIIFGAPKLVMFLSADVTAGCT